MSMFFGLKRCWPLLYLGLIVLVTLPAQAKPLVSPLQRAALPVAAPERALFLDIASAGQRLVAVGERGLIVFSDDQGKHWQQASVPVAVSLTAVDFASPSLGWAVGHSGVILHTRDGGESWHKQLDGEQAAALAMAEAQQAAANKPEDEIIQGYLSAAKWLLKEGADKPFLDLHFLNENKGIVVGAYGLLLRTEDGGNTWSSQITASANPMGMNLYAIGEAEGTLYIVGEQGFFAASTNEGASFEAIATPYEGTWFVVSHTADKHIFLGGLRGNAYRYQPEFKRFHEVNINTGTSFNSVLKLSDGRLLFVDQSGKILESSDHGASVHFLQRPPGAPLVVLAEVMQKKVMRENAAEEKATQEKIAPAENNRQPRLVGAGFGGLASLQLRSNNEVITND